MADPISLFLKLDGEITRPVFWLGFAGLFILVTGGNYILGQLGSGMASFWLPMIFVLLYFHVIYCVFGKRLRHMGHTNWFLTAMIALEFIAVIVVMLSFGGAEYFEAFSQYSRKDDIDPAVREAIVSEYQATLEAHQHLTRPLLLGIPVLVTAYAGLARWKYFSKAA